MNLLRKLSFSLVFVLAALSLRAQAVIDLSAYIDDETAAQLGDNNAAALKNKISKIITRNGMADAAAFDAAAIPTAFKKFAALVRARLQ